MSSVMSRLLWKDYRSVRGLLLALPVIILLLSLTAEIVGLLSGVRRSELNGMYATIWVLLPGLYALGLPAILIGSEQESGSLDWLKMLPARWWQIFLSKFIICLVGVVLAWVPTSGLLYLSASAAGDLPVSSVGIGLAVLVGLLIYLFVNLTSAFLFRSPVTAIMLAFPMMIATYVGLALLGGWWVNSRSGEFDPQAARMVALVTLTSVAFFVWLALMVLSAKRRLSTYRDGFVSQMSGGSPLSGFRPPVDREISAEWSIPGQYRALFWSHLSPIRWQLGFAIALGLISLALGFGDGGMNRTWIFVFMPVVVFTLGALTFFGDSSNRQVAFFFDRGLGGSKIWITRVVPLTLIAAVLILLHLTLTPLSFLDERYVQRPWYGNGSMMMACIWFSSFAVGHLVSQWASRTTLSFFAGPVLFYFLSTVSLIWYYYYPGAVLLTLLSSLVLFVASYRLLDVWISRQTNTSRYLIPWTGWIAFALFLPLPMILSARWVTTPAERTQWREEMLASAPPMSKERQRTTAAILATLKVRSAVWQGEPSDVSERMQAELEESEKLGTHVSIMDVIGVIDPTHSGFGLRTEGWSRVSGSPPAEKITLNEDRLLALRVLESWSKEIRQQLIDGKADFLVLRDVAEPIDHVRAQALRLGAGEFGLEVETLKDALPTREELYESRRMALVRSWGKYQTQRERSHLKQGAMQFLGEYAQRYDPWWLAVERTRTDRYVDEVAVLILESWKNRSVVNWVELERMLREIGIDDLFDWSGKKAVGIPEVLRLMHANDQLINSLRQPKRISSTILELSLAGI
ncbi:MAG: hypothetical protein AAF802_18735 [Planctomycetota bacterium]